MTDTFRGCGLGSFIAYCIATALFIVGFGAPYWMTSARDYQGLWRFCYVDFPLCEDFIANNGLQMNIPGKVKILRTALNTFRE